MKRRLTKAQQSIYEVFADALSDTGSVAQAAQKAGLTLKAGQARFARMRRDLGAQAQ